MDEESTAVNTEVVEQNTTATESASVENESSEVTDDESWFDDKDITGEAETEVKEESKDKSGETEAETKSREDKPLSPKAQNRFQELANRNRELSAKLAELEAQQSRVNTEADLFGEINPNTGEYYTQTEIQSAGYQKQLELQQSSIEAQKQALVVEQNVNVLRSEVERALDEFPQFDENSDQYDADLARQVDPLLGAILKYDQKGNIVGASSSPYQLYKTIAASAERAAAKERSVGVAKAQRATEQMLSRADTTGSTAPTKVDESQAFIDNFFK